METNFRFYSCLWETWEEHVGDDAKAEEVGGGLGEGAVQHLGRHEPDCAHETRPDGVTKNDTSHSRGVHNYILVII